MADREAVDAYFGHPGFVGSHHPLAGPPVYPDDDDVLVPVWDWAAWGFPTPDECCEYVVRVTLDEGPGQLIGGAGVDQWEVLLDGEPILGDTRSRTVARTAIHETNPPKEAPDAHATP